MGEYADMHLDGTLCECCGVTMRGPGNGEPRRCSDCGPIDATFVHPSAKVACPTCKKRVKFCGLTDHIRAAHPPAPRPAAKVEATGSDSLAIKALRYYRDECSGADPSISVFHQMLDEALDAQPEPAERKGADGLPVSAPRLYADEEPPEPAAPDLAAIRLEAHEHGVKCMAESLRKILDGEPCEASVPPELAEVAKRLAAPSVAPEPLKGWKLNHVQFVRGTGKAEIGYLDSEDDRFSPIVTVDTGLYYEPDQAHPLAIAILEALQATHPPRAPLPETLHTFLNAAAGEGLVLDGVDAADLYIALFPERYAAAVNSIDSGAAK